MKRFQTAAVCAFSWAIVGCGEAIEFSGDGESMATERAAIDIVAGAFPGNLHQLGAALAMGDFDGDTWKDLAIGVPGKDVNGHDGAGVVVVVFGTAGTPSTTQLIQPSTFIGNPAGPDEGFGSALAAGDFDGDDIDDLAIGVPGQTRASQVNAGMVNVLYGTGSGLSTLGSDAIAQDLGGLTDDPEEGDLFGASLVSGNFDDDEYDDLAIGIPGETLAGVVSAGAVHVLPGASLGLGLPGQFIHQGGLYNVAGTSSDGDQFGKALAAGDINLDGRDELVVGIPGETVNGQSHAGAIHYLWGDDGTGGVLVNGVNGPQVHQDSVNIVGTAEAWDGFGSSLAIGNFGGSDHRDLAIGVPGEDIGSAANAGSINILRGSRTGIGWADNVSLHKDSANVSGTAADEDRFGIALSGGNYDGDGFDDLAVGVAFQAVNGFAGAGAVYVFPGATAGPSGSNEVVITEQTVGVEDVAEAGDHFGRALVSGDFDRDFTPDLCIGSPGEGHGLVTEAGAAHVLFGSTSGITGTGSFIFTE